MTARRRVTELLREIATELVDSETPDGDYQQIAEALEPIRKELSLQPRRNAPARVVTDAEGNKTVRRDMSMVEFNPTHGASNVLAPPLECSLTGERAWAEVTYGRLFEGHPGYVHGGFVTCAFDEILGHATSLRKETVVTGTITVKFRKPVPLGRKLRYEAWTTRTSGRRVLSEANLCDGDTVLCEAHAIYVRIDADRYAAMLDPGA